VKPLRIALVALGVAIALYGIASLTGGWLGEPPWWVVRREVDELTWILMQGKAHAGSAMDRTYRVVEPRPGREWISGGVVAAGLALAIFAPLPRRPRADVVS
jgi:hypothetical protein